MSDDTIEGLRYELDLVRAELAYTRSQRDKIEREWADYQRRSAKPRGMDDGLAGSVSITTDETQLRYDFVIDRKTLRYARSDDERAHMIAREIERMAWKVAEAVVGRKQHDPPPGVLR